MHMLGLWEGQQGPSSEREAAVQVPSQLDQSAQAAAASGQGAALALASVQETSARCATKPDPVRPLRRCTAAST